MIEDAGAPERKGLEMGFEKFGKGARVCFRDERGDSPVGALMADITPDSHFIEIQPEGGGNPIGVGWREKPPPEGGFRSIEPAGENELLVKDYGRWMFRVVLQRRD